MSASPALAPANSPTNKPAATVALALSVIRPDPENRKDHDPGLLKNLAEDIKSNTLLQPIVVRKLTTDEIHKSKSNFDAWYQIIAGERRYEAHKILKAPTIECRVVDGIDALKAITMQTAENLQREPLNPIQEARQMRRLAELKMPQSEIGKLFRLSQPMVANTLKLLVLPERVQQLVAGGELEAAAALELARFIAWPKACTLMAERYCADENARAKDLRGGLSYNDDLVRAGLASKFETYDWSDDSYKVTKEMTAELGYFTGSYHSYYLHPEDPKAPNHWLQEKARQDKARQQKVEAEQKKAAGAKSSGKPTKQQLERKKKIAENRKCREQNAIALRTALSVITASKEVHQSMLATLLLHVLNDHHYRGHIKDAAATIGIKLPAGFFEATAWSDRISFSKLASLSPVDQVRLAAAAVSLSEGSEAIKYSWRDCEQLKTISSAAGRKLGEFQKKAEQETQAAAAAKKGGKK